MAVLFAAVLATLHLEYDDFFTFYQWLKHFTHYFGAIYGRSAHFHGSLIVYEEHFLKLNRLAFLCILDMMHEQFLALFSLELLTVDFYNCVHFYIV